MNKTAVVTGAGSGVGRAVAIQLAGAGWNIVLVGRTETALRHTQGLTGGEGKTLAHAADVSDAGAVQSMAVAAATKFGTVSLLVNAAGTNAPERGLDVLSLATYRALMETNLTGAFLCAQALLPGMRRQQAGTVVNVVSDAGLRANAKAGAAYVMSKFGMAGLTQSINAEERNRGIRACAIFPGDIDTPILEKRPVPPPPEARRNMLQAQDVADCVMLVVNLPMRATVEELIIRPRAGG